MRNNNRITDYFSEIASLCDEFFTMHRSEIIFRAALSLALNSPSVLSIYPFVQCIGCAAFDMVANISALEDDSTIFRGVTPEALAFQQGPLYVSFRSNESNQVPIPQLNADFIEDNDLTQAEFQAADELSRSTGEQANQISAQARATFHLSPLERKLVMLILAYGLRAALGMHSLIPIPFAD